MDYGVLSSRTRWPHSLAIDQDLVVYIPDVSKKIRPDFISALFRKLDIASVGYIHLQKKMICIMQ